MTTNILAISGSLRASSSNQTVLSTLAEMARNSIIFCIYEGIGNLPHFNPDLETQLPNEVADFRKKVSDSHGLLVSSPEYAHGVPGTLKNALDWLVADPHFPGKPIFLLNTSTGDGEYVTAQLVETLKTMSANIMFSAALPGPLVRQALKQGGLLSDSILRSRLTACMAAISGL